MFSKKTTTKAKKAHVTGSRAYGQPKADSDIEGYSIRYGRLNVTRDKFDPDNKYHMIIQTCGHIRFLQYGPTNQFYVTKGYISCQRCKNAPK